MPLPPSHATAPTTPPAHRAGTSAYRQATLALFAAAMATFMTLYYVQGLLPALAAEFSVSPTVSALAISATTVCIATAIVPVSALSERFGRVRVMVWSTVSATVVGLALPWSPTFELLLGGRALQGVLCAGVPAAAMAYLAEEIEGHSLGKAMGLYVAGSSIGGVVGRLLPALSVDFVRWELAFQSVTVLALLSALVFAWKVPPSARFTTRRISLGSTVRELRAHFRDPVLVSLFGVGFVVMGTFVTVYNYLTFRLLDPPFSLPPMVVALVFTMYLTGAASATLAGRSSDRIGRALVLLTSVSLMAGGLVISLVDSLAVLLVGVALCTVGFFAAHSVASAWVGARAVRNRAGASSLYLLAYYLGSSVVSVFGGAAFTTGGWDGMSLYLGGLLAAAMVASAVLGLRPAPRPLAPGRSDD
ncbi:MFS transporter [Dietzia sp. CH92]|uniref:MFS transporter n=1 Tax=Dietzia sp. CH92 TaxID=3051823 RepID=UPI0028D3E8E5|nr:MFS transporter [Dietzia sp. CH92]